ncbi:MAG TPA: GWxTD domain-containing protein [Terriglobales bacterium]|jgi:GWxTD domain-containing protein|nr:GWxTD domain-containing protein [Terriglobales bacterium]
MTSVRFLSRFSAIALGLLIFTALVWAQSSTDTTKEQSSDQKQVTGKQSAADPLKRPLSKKQKEKNAKALREELAKPYKQFLQDVIYIITQEELDAFAKLSNDEERDQFIEIVWHRRNPTPDSPENEFKDEHYRRLTYANEHFAAGIPGWRTDRGMIYIKFGKPDEIESHPSGGTYQRPIEEGGGMTSTYPFEDWRYRHIDGIGDDINIEFVDDCQCGAYRMTMNPEDKNALAHVPGAGQQPMANGLQSQQNSKEFDRLEQYVGLLRQAEFKFKGLKEHVSHIIGTGPMPFDVRTDFVKTGSDAVLVPVTIQVRNKDITFETKDGVARGVVNISGTVSTMTQFVAQTFGDTVSVEVPAELLEKTTQNRSIYWKAIPLHPGRYLMDVVVKDMKGDRISSLSRALTVPEFGDDKLASSSLILADRIEKVSTKSVGAGNCVIDDTKVCPRVEPSDGKPAGFRRDQKMNFWMQVYNLGIDEQSKKPSATIEYDVVNIATNKPIAHMVESTDTMGKVGDKITLERSMPLASLEPGTYRLTIKVNDNVSKQTITPSANFAVE